MTPGVAMLLTEWQVPGRTGSLSSYWNVSHRLRQSCSDCVLIELKPPRCISLLDLCMCVRVRVCVCVSVHVCMYLCVCVSVCV